MSAHFKGRMMTSMTLSEKLLNFLAYDKEIYIKSLF